MFAKYRLLVLACVAGASLYAAVGASAGPTPAPCAASKLSVKMTHIFGSDGAGHTGYSLTIKNDGASPCRLGNHPRLRLEKANGSSLPTHVSDSGASKTVMIAAHHSRSAKLRFSPDVPGPGEGAPGRPCEPVAHKVKVTLTAPAVGHLVGSVQPATSVCEHGSMIETGLS